MDENDAKTGVGATADSSGKREYGAWSAGWLMGIGFGTLVMFSAEELTGFYERFRYILAGGGVLALGWGLVRLRKTNLSVFKVRRGENSADASS